MAARTSQTTQDIPQGRFLTEEEVREIKENLARTNFGMTLDEFTKAWKAGEFEGDRERHKGDWNPIIAKVGRGRNKTPLFPPPLPLL